MERKELDVYSEASNFGIVRMPGRRFPACAIQGDSLCNLFHNAVNLLSRLKADGACNEAIEEAEGLVRMLRARLDHYESVLTEHGIELPYVRRSAE